MKISFLGGGNMASSLVGGLIADDYNHEDIAVADINGQRLKYFRDQFSIKCYDTIQAAAEIADIIVLSVKPQVLKTVAQQLVPVVAGKRVLVISIAAGIRTADIGQWIGSEIAIVRAMPNTPALVQCGASGLFANDNVVPEQREQAESILRATGLVIWVDDEAQLDAVTALSGSGPAYFFRIMEAMEAAGVKCGLPQKTASLLTLQTALGAAKLALESTEDLAALRQSVTSPGGTTEQGLKVMDENNIDKIMEEVINAAKERAIELADQLGACRTLGGK